MVESGRMGEDQGTSTYTCPVIDSDKDRDGAIPFITSFHGLYNITFFYTKDMSQGVTALRPPLMDGVRAYDVWRKEQGDATMTGK
jgi:hypothetical protein